MWLPTRVLKIIQFSIEAHVISQLAHTWRRCAVILVQWSAQHTAYTTSICVQVVYYSISKRMTPLPLMFSHSSIVYEISVKNVHSLVHRCAEWWVMDCSMGWLDAILFFFVSLTHAMAYILRCSIFLWQASAHVCVCVLHFFNASVLHLLVVMIS